MNSIKMTRVNNLKDHCKTKFFVVGTTQVKFQQSNTWQSTWASLSFPSSSLRH